MIGVIKVVPVPRLAPPVAVEYQFIVPADVVASNETVPVPQTLPGVVAVIAGIEFTVAVTAVLIVVVHPLAVAST